MLDVCIGDIDTNNRVSSHFLCPLYLPVFICTTSLHARVSMHVYLYEYSTPHATIRIE